MIKEKTVTIKWCYQTREYYENLGYKYTGNLTSFTIPLKHISHGSNVKITGICDICGKEQKQKYQDYLKSETKYGYYTCYKCSRKKIETTSLKKYGVKCPLSASEIIQKRMETNLQRYGVASNFDKDAPKEIVNKINKSMIKKYGVGNIFQNKEYIIAKNIEKYHYPYHQMSEQQKKKFYYGKNNLTYNPNLTDADRISRRYDQRNKLWRKAIMIRDNYTCVCCGYNKGGILVAHHIFSYKSYQDLRYDINNGATLCEPCHKRFHSQFGYGNNTQKQFTSFLNQYNKGQTTIQ